MPPSRVVAFIDGFNLYHAIEDTGQDHLKWLNLRALVDVFAPAPDFTVSDVLYFSAYATWRADAYKRHREFVKALQAVGVTPILGNFKAKDRACFKCGHRWQDHEEKETDVNIAIHMVLGASQDTFDRALLITGDSDLAPPVKMIRTRFPNKQIRVIAPIGRPYSMELFRAAGGSKHCRQMQTIHLERCLLPQEVLDSVGNVLAVRPAKYDPPPA